MRIEYISSRPYTLWCQYCPCSESGKAFQSPRLSIPHPVYKSKFPGGSAIPTDRPTKAKEDLTWTTRTNGSRSNRRRLATCTEADSVVICISGTLETARNVYSRAIWYRYCKHCTRATYTPNVRTSVRRVVFVGWPCMVQPRSKRAISTHR